METVGYIGAFLLAICAFPQTVASLYSGNSHGLTWSFLWAWFMGEILMLSYIVHTHGPGGPVFWNLLVNIILLTPIVYYKHFPRGKHG